MLMLLCGQRDLTLDLSSTQCSINFYLILAKEFALRQFYVYWENLIMQSGKFVVSSIFFLKFMNSLYLRVITLFPVCSYYI